MYVDTESGEVPLYDLIYVSVATQDLTLDELKALVKKARSRNENREVTGLLAYDEVNRSFVQILEGPRKAVLDIFDIIEKDDRHNDIRVLRQGDRDPPDRRFGDWNMALVEPAYFKAIVFEHL
ncbi:MAG: BLUF domain-containing protein [Pseudomonadota bacterium]